MHFICPPRPAFLLSLCLMAAFACKKGSSSSIGSGNPTPAITPIGTPVGNPVSKNIDASGGSLASPDGKLSLVIPAGALPAGMAISIQPVTNAAPGGLGSAYQLLPEGTKFSKPVTITFHYTDADVNGSLPYFLYIAFQDSTGSWEADLKQRDLDTVAKTVSITSTHFSIWSAFIDIKMISGQDEYHANETNYFEVIEVVKHGTKQADDPGGDVVLYSLPVTSTLPDNIVSNWSINGEGTHTLVYGNIVGTGGHVTYAAPVAIDDELTAQVSADIKFTDIITSYSSGKQIASFNKLSLFHSITLLPDDLSFSLAVEIADSQPAQTTFDFGYTYIQRSTMDLKIEGSNVIVSNIANNPPQITTTASAVGDQCHIVSVTQDDIGELHITSGKGTADSQLGIFNVTLTVAAGNTIQYTYQCNCMNCAIGNHPPTSFPEEKLDTPDFTLTNSAQSSPPPTDPTHYTKFTLTPK